MGVFDDVLIGRVLGGKFRLRRVVGKGSSGAVYQADQTALGRTVAVKVLRQDLALDPRLVARFHDEALAASRLNHPNIVSVIDYGQADDGLLYIVMEYLRGFSLTEVLRDEAPLPDTRVIELVSQVLSGLEEAHHAGVIHADLKSDNIVVENRRGGWDLVKVVDFGIARLMETSSEPQPQDDEKRTVCGTPEYMAPEVISGSAPTVASDLYAVGVVLYEMLVGSTPFVGGNSLDVLTRHLRQEPIAPSVKRPELQVSPAIERIVMRALAKKPADRFASAVEFRAALQQARNRGERAASAGGTRIVCEGCGCNVPTSFKFCPECGHRLATGTVIESLLEVTTEPHRVAVGSEALPAARERDTIDDLDAVEATPSGILPLPFIGRDEAVDAVMEFVAASEPPLLQIVGSTGSGRTRILREVYSRLAEDVSCLVYQTGPDPTGLASPFHPIRAVVAAVLALPPICAYDTLSSALERLGLSRRDLPGITELFGHHGELWQLEPHIRRRELVASTVRVLRAATAQGRAVLLFDDLDRYDRPSRELLAHLVEAMDASMDGPEGPDQPDSRDRPNNPDSPRNSAEEERPLRIIVAHDSGLAELWPDGVARVDLAPFSADELAALALHLEESGHDGMPGADELAAHTDGTPGHIQHLVRFIIEGGSVESAPETVVDLIAERMHALPHSALVVCQTAAVLGIEAARDLLIHALGPGMRDAFEDALSVLQARGLLFDDDGVIGFTSQLVRDVVYDATPADVRRELHCAAIDALSPFVADPLILGHHRDMAGNLAEAAALLMRAGDDATHQLDDVGATQLYHRALEAARKLMLRDADGDSRLRFVVLSVKLAEALRVRGNTLLARGIIEEARSYSDGSRAIEAQLMQASAHLSQVEGKLDVALDTLRRAIGLLIPLGQMELLSELYLDLSSLHMERDDVQSAITELGEGLDLITMGEGVNATEGPEILWRLLLRLAQLYSTGRQPNKALALAQSALIHARRVRSRIGSARVQTLLASHYEQAGNLSLAAQYRQAAVNEMRRLGDRRGTAELILAGRAPTRTLLRVNPAERREARELAGEVGWLEGVLRADHGDVEKHS